VNPLAPIQVSPGGSTQTTVRLSHCPVGRTGTTVGVGPGVTASGVQSSYDDATDTGFVSMTLTARPDAPVGAQPLAVFWGGRRCASAQSIVGVGAGSCPAIAFLTATPTTVTVGHQIQLLGGELGNGQLSWSLANGPGDTGSGTFAN